MEGEFNVNYVTDVDKEQRHVGTLTDEQTE